MLDIDFGKSIGVNLDSRTPRTGRFTSPVKKSSDGSSDTVPVQFPDWLYDTIPKLIPSVPGLPSSKDLFDIFKRVNIAILGLIIVIVGFVLLIYKPAVTTIKTGAALYTKGAVGGDDESEEE